MTTEIAIHDESCIAENDLRTKQFYCMEPSGVAKNTLRVDVCDNAGDLPIGILQNKPNAGEAATVRFKGISRAVSDGNAGAIAAGDWVGTNNAGKVVKKTTDKDFVIGRAMEASSVDGAIIAVWLAPGYLSV